MAFSHVPLGRTVPAGALAYLAQYLGAFALLGSHTGTLLQSVQIDRAYSGQAALAARQFSDDEVETASAGW